MPQVHTAPDDKKQQNARADLLKTRKEGTGRARAGGFLAQARALSPDAQGGYAAQAQAMAPTWQAPLRPQALHNVQVPNALPPLPALPGNAPARPQTPAPMLPAAVGPQAPARPQMPAPMLAPVLGTAAANATLAGASNPQVLTEKHEKTKFFGGSTAKALGGGTLNDVTKVAYKKRIGDSDTKKGFFKVGTAGGSAAADQVGIGRETGAARMRPSKKDPSKMIRVRPDEIAAEDPRMAARAVASTRLDRALGTNVLAAEAFGQRNGQIGNVSAQVPGRALVENQTDAAGNLESQTYHRVDERDPAYQRSLADLGVVDYLSGQVDRHSGNIFYDPATGGVKGIDNDMAFGQWDHQNDKGTTFGNGLDALPAQIDHATAGVIRTMTEAQFRTALTPRPGDPQGLSAPEIDKALERFRTLKAHIATLQKNGALVQQWDDQTYADACNNPTGTYLGRHHEAVAQTNGTGNSAQDKVVDLPKANR